MGVIALLSSWLSVSVNALPWWMENRDVSDPVAFARAGTMHNYSYLGGLLGLIIGLLFSARVAWTSRRSAK